MNPLAADYPESVILLTVAALHVMHVRAVYDAVFLIGIVVIANSSILRASRGSWTAVTDWRGWLAQREQERRVCSN